MVDAGSKFHINASFLNVSRVHSYENEALTPSSSKTCKLLSPA